MSGGHRKRMKRYENSNEARFLTFSCFKRLQLFGNERIRDAFVKQLNASRHQYDFRLCAYVVMLEHVHLLIVPAAGSKVSTLLQTLKAGFAHDVLGRWRDLDARVLAQITDDTGHAHFWQAGGGYDRNIFSKKEFTEKLTYIHANPVKAGLVAMPTEWKWSSARWYAGERGEDVVSINPWS